MKLYPGAVQQTPSKFGMAKRKAVKAVKAWAIAEDGKFFNSPPSLYQSKKFDDGEPIPLARSEYWVEVTVAPTRRKKGAKHGN